MKDTNKKLRFRLLGRSGLRVSEISLGTMTFGEEWGFGVDMGESRKVFETYVEAGGNFIDTANNYTKGTSERYVGQLVGTDRERFVIASKYTLSTRTGDMNASGNHRKNLVQSVNASLERLGTDYIDLLWMHAWDGLTPVEEVMRGLDDLVSAGKVLYVGVSDTPAWVVSQANTLATLRGWSPFVGLQIQYSLIERTVERDLLPMARAFGLSVTPWGVVGGGVLTGKYTRGSGDPKDSRRVQFNASRRNERNLTIAREVDRIANVLDRPASQIAFNWVRQQGSDIIPIIGARTAAQLRETLGCLDFELDADQMKRLDEASRVDLGFPHTFLTDPFILDILHGDLRDRLELPAGPR